jgi:hypothetical protein
MKLYTILLIACFLLGVSSSANADFNPSKIQWPRHIMESQNAESLISFLSSAKEIERDAACNRIGELGDKIFVESLMRAFENEKIRTGIDLPYGVKYYSLISIGKIGGSTAEVSIRKIVRNHLLYSLRPDQNSTSDTILVLIGAFEALSEIKTNSARMFLDSLYEDENLYWLIRSMANLNSMRIKLAGVNYFTKADTAQFLIVHLDSLGGPLRQFDDEGCINDSFIVANNIESLIYEYRSWMIPFWDNYIDSLIQKDPRLSGLRKFKKIMESNPPQPQK